MLGLLLEQPYLKHKLNNQFVRLLKHTITTIHREEFEKSVQKKPLTFSASGIYE